MKHQIQLVSGVATRGVDCGVRTILMCLDWASGGELLPNVKQFRDKMDDNDTTNPWDWLRGIDGFRRELKKVGLGPIRRKLHDGDDKATLRKILFEKKRPVAVVIDYGKLARRNKRLWSSTSFRGLHAVVYRYGKTKNGRKVVKVFDPLADGRTVGGKKMVRGPRFWPWDDAWAVASGVSTLPPGKWLGVSFWRCLPLVANEDPPIMKDPDPDLVEEEDEDDFDFEGLWELLGDMEEAMESQERVYEELVGRFQLLEETVSEEPESGIGEKP